MKKIILFGAIALSTSMLNSCSKDGAIGPAGPQGSAGTNGTNGNANVKALSTITASWTFDATDSSYNDSVPITEITADIFNHGVVQVYALYYGTQWWCLPDINGKNATSFGFGSSYLWLYSINLDGTKPALSQIPTSYRVVVITASMRLAHPNTNWKNYLEVKKALNLQDDEQKINN